MPETRLYYLKTDSTTDLEQLKKLMEELHALGFDSSIMGVMQDPDTERYESRHQISKNYA